MIDSSHSVRFMVIMPFVAGQVMIPDPGSVTESVISDDLAGTQIRV